MGEIIFYYYVKHPKNGKLCALIIILKHALKYY
jgi:hypothetical protein